MKRLLCFLPTIIVLGFLAFILLFLGNPSVDPYDYLIGGGILFVFALSDFLLSKKLWFGGIPGALLGAYVIYYGSQYHGQVMDERPIGAVILAYYLILGILTAYSYIQRNVITSSHKYNATNSVIKQHFR